MHKMFYFTQMLFPTAQGKNYCRFSLYTATERCYMVIPGLWAIVIEEWHASSLSTALPEPLQN